MSLLIYGISGYSQKLEIPKLKSEITDKAQLLSQGEKSKIIGLLKKVRQMGGAHVALLTVNSLKGETIEGYSIRVMDEWKLGDDKKDNGALLLIAKKERKMRIEVGQGLEGDLTDYESHKIIKEVITPHLKKGDFFAGISSGLVEILKETDTKIMNSIFKGSASSQRVKGKPKDEGISIFKIIFYIILLILFIRNPMDFLMMMMLFGGGGRGGFSSRGGGGGFSGGGGGFSGGGASGDW